MSELIQSEDERIEIVSASDFKDVIFPYKDYRVSSFFEAGNRRRIAKELDVDYAIFLGHLEKAILSHGGGSIVLIAPMGYGGFWGAEYQKEKATLSASIIDLYNERPLSRIKADAEGITGGLGVFYGLLLISLEDSSVKKGLARQIAQTLFEHSKKNSLRVTIFVLDSGYASIATLEKRDTLRKKLADGDESYETKKELAVLGDYQPLERLAWDGHPDAAIDLYRLTGDIRPLRNLKEQGNPRATAVVAAWEAEDARLRHLANASTRKRAGAEDPDVQFQLYYSLKTDERLISACRAADNGNAFARYRVAMIFEKGLEGVERDNARAQMWYRLAAASGHVWGNANADRLAQTGTDADSDEALRLLNNWQPGQCEAEFFEKRSKVEKAL
jgi:hypothetical protein